MSPILFLKYLNDFERHFIEKHFVIVHQIIKHQKISTCICADNTVLIEYWVECLQCNHDALYRYTGKEKNTKAVAIRNGIYGNNEQ